MSTLKVDGIRSNSASSDAITLASDGTATANLTTVNSVTMPNGGFLSNRNLVINGAMQVAQRGTSSNVSGYGTVDRFQVNFDSGITEAPTHAQADVASGTTPYTLGFRKAFKITNGNQTSQDANDYIQLAYKIEAQDVANSGWNYTSSSSNITLSFWVKASIAQTMYARLNAEDASKAFSFAFSATTSWTKITKTISGDSNLVFNNDTGVGLALYIIPFYGTSYTTSGHTNDAWVTDNGSDQVTDMATTWFSGNDATLEVTGLQLEVGSVATDFEHRSYAQELALCKRYYQQFPQSAADNYGPIGVGRIRNSTNAHIVLTFPEMRSSPTCTKSGNLRILHAATGTVVNSVASSHMARSTVFIEGIVSSGLAQGEGCILTADNDADGRITLSAEL